jgi:hypothetical protein
MDDLYSYHIRIAGQASEADINAASPLRLSVEQSSTATLLTVRTDQSGLIGLIRHLHGLGFVLLLIERHPL